MYKKSTLVKRVRWLIIEGLMLDVRSQVSTSTNLELAVRIQAQPTITYLTSNW